MKYSVESVNKKIIGRSNLTCIEQAPSRITPTGKKIVVYLFRCICGKEVLRSVRCAISLQTKSCGCTKYLNTRKYGDEFNQEIYQAWYQMVARCSNPKNINYSRYGAKGVVVCEEWQEDFHSFLKWSLLNGWAAGLQIDKDILGNGFLYSPNTCKWVSAKENAANRVTSIKHEHKGRVLTLPEICREEGIVYWSAKAMRYKGRSLEYILQNARKFG